VNRTQRRVLNALRHHRRGLGGLAKGTSEASELCSTPCGIIVVGT
jgi:hypothetical protein